MGGTMQKGSAAGGAVAAAAVLVSEEAAMEEHFVWVTTRQIRPGALADFEGAWRLSAHPEGMLRAYAYWSEDETEVVGVSFWDSKESCEAWRASETEAAGGRRWLLTSLRSKRRSTGAVS